MAVKVPTRMEYLQRWSEMQTERASFWPHWQELSRFIQPRSGRFFLQDRNNGQKKHNDIIDSTASRALRTLAAGMQAGMTSPARPWFRLALSDKELMEYGPVRQWLSDVTELMREVFQKSNTYRALHKTYGELGLFGTGCDLIVDDFKNVIHHMPFTVGEYALATDFRGNVNAMYREFELTVGQLVGEFGPGNVSATVRNLYDRGSLGAWVPVLHLIEPRKDRDPNLRDSANMAFASLYCETGQDADKMLRVSGFKEFPVLAPRWDVESSDIYGSSPGMEALGDVKQLQHQQRRKSQAIDYQVKPPLSVPNSLKNREVDTLPGGVTYYDAAGNGPSGGIRSLFEVNLNLGNLLEDIQDVRGRINQTFYADLFLMLANDDRSNITAREVAERHEEKLLMLGPVVERLNNELLDPIIDVTFAKIVENGLLPPVPPELEGVDINIEYVSVLAQAQRAVGTASVDRLLGTVGAVAQMKPDVLDKLDGDQIVDHYADILGVDPSLIVADDKVAIVRQRRVEQQAQMQQAAMMQPVADTAKKLADAKVTDDSALAMALDQFSQ